MEINEPLSNMSREEALDFKHNANWKNLCKEIKRMVIADNEKLLTCKSEDLIRLQERIKAFKFCINLPDIIAEREE